MERRRDTRYNFSASVFVRLLIEEETFNPLRLPGQSRNIGSGGMLVEVQGLSEEQYKMLIRRQRMVRIHAELPEAEGETVFFGRVVWYDYWHTSKGTSCQLGITFETLHEKAEQVLANVLRRLETKATAILKPDSHE